MPKIDIDRFFPRRVVELDKYPDSVQEYTICVFSCRVVELANITKFYEKVPKNDIDRFFTRRVLELESYAGCV